MKNAADEINRSQDLVDRDALDGLIRKAFHEHDWELVDVHVKKLGEMPTKIRFCAHGAPYDLKPRWPAP